MNRVTFAVVPVSNRAMKDLIPIERIEKRILLLRGQKVMLSMDLAELYEVAPKVLVQAVKRNSTRLPVYRP